MLLERLRTNSFGVFCAGIQEFPANVLRGSCVMNHHKQRAEKFLDLVMDPNLTEAFIC